MDVAAYERRSCEGPCFVCETLAGNPDYPADVVWEGHDAVAFLARYNTLLGHTLVVPRAHREPVTADFRIEEYLTLQRLVFHVGEALRLELPTERLYIMSLGSQSGNRHVHWHVAPLPPGCRTQRSSSPPSRGIGACSPSQRARRQPSPDASAPGSRRCGGPDAPKDERVAGRGTGCPCSSFVFFSDPDGDALAIWERPADQPPAAPTGGTGPPQRPAVSSSAAGERGGMADAPGLGPGGATRGGSNPPARTPP
jgi:diadenosine tetraphosphate (Ap4A) HIT family hydrolase